jgi:hypothetical protein
MTHLIAPWAVATLAGVEAWDDQTLGEVERCGRVIGEEREVDADLLREGNYGDLADRLVAYDEKCRAYWAGDPRGDYLLAHRTLHVKTQVDRGGERSDLIEELAFLHGVNGAKPYLSELLSKAPDDSALELLAGPVEAVLERGSELLRAKATIRIIEPLSYPAGLGGLASYGEVARVFVLDVNWAKWRDRDVRRLVSVTSVAEEVWPVPDGVGQTRAA